MAQKFKVLDTTTGKYKFVSALVTWQQEVPTGSVNGTNTNFVLSYTPVSAMAVFVYLDSLLLMNTMYSVNLGTKTVTFNTAPATGQQVYVAYNR